MATTMMVIWWIWAWFANRAAKRERKPRVFTLL